MEKQVTSPAAVVCGPWDVDVTQQRATLNGREISLTTTEFRLMVELALKANHVVSHVSLLEAVWGPEYVGEIDYLRTYVRRLRGKIGDDASRPQYIVSKTNVGYMLVADN